MGALNPRIAEPELDSLAEAVSGEISLVEHRIAPDGKNVYIVTSIELTDGMN